MYVDSCIIAGIIRVAVSVWLVCVCSNQYFGLSIGPDELQSTRRRLFYYLEPFTETDAPNQPNAVRVQWRDQRQTTPSHSSSTFKQSNNLHHSDVCSRDLHQIRTKYMYVYKMSYVVCVLYAPLVCVLHLL